MKPSLSKFIAAKFMLGLIAIAILPSAARAEGATKRDIDALSTSKYIEIATVRKDGNQSRAATVWFIKTADNQVLIETSPTSWKAKRIKRGSPAMIWIGSEKGPAFIGKAEIVSDKALQDQVIEEYPRKYIEARLGFARPSREKIDSGKIVVIRITPVRDLPEGYLSQPGTPAPALEEKGEAKGGQKSEPKSQSTPKSK